MRRPSRSTQSIVRGILSGESFEHGLQLLQRRPRAAIRHLLDVVEGKGLDIAKSGLQQREVADLADAALCGLGASHPELLIAFLERSLVAGTTASCFALTWALAHSGTLKGFSTSAKALEHRDRFVRWADARRIGPSRGDALSDPQSPPQ